MRTVVVHHSISFDPDRATARKISSDVRRASTSKTKGRARKNRTTRNSPEIDVLRTNTPDDPFDVDEERSSAYEMRQMGLKDGKVDSIRQYNITQSKNRYHNTDQHPDPVQPRRPAQQPRRQAQQPRRQAQQPNPTQKHKTPNKAQTQDSPGTKPMNALSTLYAFLALSSVSEMIR